MTRIDRYISKLFWSFFASGLIVFVTVFIAVDALSTLVQYKDVPGESLLKYYIFYTPEIIHKLLPVACLIGTVLTLSTLNKASELIALFAAGLSLLRISMPILVGVFVISLFGFLISDQLLPSVLKEKNFIYYNIIEKKPGKFSVVKTDRIWYRTKNTIFNIKTLNPEAGTAQGVSIYFFNDNWDLLQLLSAQSVEFKGNQWKLLNGSVIIFSTDSSFPLTSQFQSKSIVMSEDVQDLQKTGQTSDLLNQKELSQFITKNKVAGLETTRYEVDYHSKFGFAFAGLIMSLLGIPLSISRQRSGGAMMNVGLCIGLVFAYWVFYSSGLTLGNHGTIPPLAAAWVPNLMMGGVAVFFLKKRGF